jgi:membrane-bound lytic murein transglycosylase F
MRQGPSLALTRSRFFPALLAGPVLALLLSSCGGSGDGAAQGRSLDDIRKSGKLIVVTRNAPTTYYFDRHGELAGFEYEMVVSFARHIGVEPEFRIIQTISGILEAVDAGRVDVGAAGLTYTLGRSENFQIGPVYQTVKQLVVGRRGGKRPKSIDDLSRVNLRVVAGSSYEERLLALKAQHPQLAWESDDSLDTEQLLEQVWNGDIDCTLSDDNIFQINRRYYPELVATMAATEPEALAWFLNRRADDLRKAIHEWFEDFSASGALQLLEEKYYGYVEIFDYVDTRKFVRRIDSRLPKYKSLFEEAAENYGLDWTLLAAQSYQESHWRPRAQSPTGVKGIMMLTLPAAEDVGVTNRLDPEQSVHGGARYLREIIDRLPEEIEEPDRTWIALAAYNVGMGHMYDARTLARRLGKNPNLWIDMQEVFPLLAHKQYYQTLNHGYARGSEPVRYVNRIRNYEDILKRSVVSSRHL